VDSAMSSDAEFDADILTFDVPDGALERAAAVRGENVITVGHCTHWYWCSWLL